MRLLSLLFCAFILFSCSTNKKVLDKTRGDLNKHLNTPFVERSLHLPDNVNFLGMGYAKRSVENNRFEDGDIEFPSQFLFVRNFTKNLQSLLGYLPISFLYRVHESDKFKSSLFFGGNIGYSTLGGGFILPYGISKNKYLINKNNALGLELGTTSYNKFNSEKKDYEAEFSIKGTLSHYYQFTPKLYSTVSASATKAEYSTNCINCPDTEEGGVSYGTNYKDHDSMVFPLGFSVQYLLLEETEVSLSYHIYKLGYEAGYDKRIVSFRFHWYFPTDG